MSELKLKCCPFCGGAARVVLDYQDNETWAQCTTRKPKRCPMSSTIIPIEEWNTRRAQPEANADAKDAQHDEPTHDNHPGYHDGMTCKQAGQWLTDYNECLLRGLTMEPIEVIKATIEADRVDAARYRYIRDTATLDNAVWEALEGYGMTNGAGELLEDEYRAGMDRAIDRAIEAARQSTPTTDAPQAKGSEVDCG